MASSTAVNPQMADLEVAGAVSTGSDVTASEITDAVSQANGKVLGAVPVIQEGLYQSLMQAMVNTAHNAANAQQQTYVTMQAATTECVMTLINAASVSSDTEDED